MARERANDGTGREWISGRDMDDFFRKIKGYQEKKIVNRRKLKVHSSRYILLDQSLRRYLLSLQETFREE